MKNKDIIKISCILFVLVVIGGCIIQDSPAQQVFPKERWEEMTPESLGVNPVVLDSALGYLDANSEGVGTDEMVIVRHGYIIWKGKSCNAKHEIFSCTKTFTSTVLGILVTQGKLKVEDLVVDYYPELAQGDDGQKAYNLIRFKDLATMSAGYQSISGNCWKLHQQGLHDESFACT
ncbi:MAG TPA: serine hydrolase domain-containing protein, partial [Anaerovoracaceae bacterium]|nr:serine hydrolase domain-containing protein [Anaerovoracaceae bacterium]